MCARLAFDVEMPARVADEIALAARTASPSEWLQFVKAIKKTALGLLGRQELLPLFSSHGGEVVA
jgi:hypothetical protein